MIIGVVREIKTAEFRVGLTPEGTRQLTEAGNEVLIETEAGAGIGCRDESYQSSGGRIASDAKTVYDQAEMIVKVKEPQPAECAMLREGQVLFTYLHLAADPEQAEGLKRSGCIAIAYETVTDEKGHLPLLRPMSEVAGRLSVQVGASLLQKPYGGKGVLIGGVPGVPPARVVVIGGGVAGTHAAEMAIGLGANVTVLDLNLSRLAYLNARFLGRVQTLYATAATVEEKAIEADLLIGAVLVPADRAPRLLTRKQMSRMEPGTVLVDIAIDQGGCFETSRPTTHANPFFTEEGLIHYCVANMPGAVPHTSTYALTNATLPYVMKLSSKGWKKALEEDSCLAKGLTVRDHTIVDPVVAQALGKK